MLNMVVVILLFAVLIILVIAYIYVSKRIADNHTKRYIMVKKKIDELANDVLNDKLYTSGEFEEYDNNKS